MKKWLLISYVLVVCLFLEILVTFMLNKNVINDYNNGVYNVSFSKKLASFTIFEKYISYYNYGNILYKNKKYDDAIFQYEKALTKKVPKDRLCDIRINLALAMINNIDVNDFTLEKQLAVLKDARNVLYEDNCANEENDEGNSKEAEDLEQKIKKLEESMGSASNEPSDPQDKPDDEKDIEEKKKEELEEKNGDSNKKRQEELQNDENLDEYQYYTGKTW